MSKLDTFISVIVIGACVVKAIAYGGSKPPPSSTNEPPNNISGDSSPTNDPPSAAAPLVQVQSPSPRMELLPLLSSTSPSHFDSIANWTARGAWCDWRTISFPDGFAFPLGTNLLTGVTLMSYGELRPSLLPNPYSLIPPLSALPQAVSLEPDASSVAYGLTPSNTLVFVWENACVNRDPTNRINAAIELFEDGSIETRFGNLVGRAVPSAPEGFVGEGQNLDWVTNAFPFAAAEIAEKGYETWLMEDCVGINEPNGRYKVSVTIAALPEHGPCYLVCGPHRMVVTQPGTYSFPLEVLTEYMAYTCPVAVPLSFSYDDGYRPESEDIPPMMDTLHLPAPLLSGSPNDTDYRYPIYRYPSFSIYPHWIPLSQAEGARVSIWFNYGGAVQKTYEVLTDLCITFFGNEAELSNVRVAQRARIMVERDGETYWDEINIYQPYHWPWEDDDDNGTNDWEHVDSTNDTSSATAP